MCNNNGNKCYDIKNVKKTYKTSLSTSIINKKNEMRKYKSNAPKLSQSNRPKTNNPLIDYIMPIMIQAVI